MVALRGTHFASMGGTFAGEARLWRAVGAAVGGKIMSMRKVLVLEDEFIVRLAVVDMLEDLGYAAREVSTLAEARDALSDAAFDAFILDINVPDGSGLTLAQEIRSRWANAAVIISSGTSAEAVTNYISLPKPFTQELLAARLEEAVASARRETT